MQISADDFYSTAAKTLYSLGLTPNQMIFWVLLATAKVVFEDPVVLTAVRYRLYPEIAKSIGMTPSAIDSLLRRTSRLAFEEPAFAPLCAYLPAGAKCPPTASVFLCMWIRMVADRVEAEKKEQEKAAR